MVSITVFSPQPLTNGWHFPPQEVVEEEASGGGLRPVGGGGGPLFVGQATGEGVEAAVLEVPAVVRQGRAQGSQLPAQAPRQQRWEGLSDDFIFP